MPSNYEARVDIRLKVNQEEVEAEIGKFKKRKMQAIRDVFKEVGDLYKSILAQRIPSLGFGELNRTFRYRTIPNTTHGLQLQAGVLDAQEFGQVHDFLRFWLYGTQKHWVSLKRHPELAEWALRKGIIYEEEGFYYSRYEHRYTKDGRPYKTRALQVSVRPHLYEVEKIKKQVIRQLIYKLQRI
jgi:hypothetical protein